MRTRFELAHAVKCFGDDLIISGKLSPLQSKVLGKIASCRTAFLGGHQEACDNCGTIRYSYNSCGDRHCPKYQAAKQAFWIDELVQSTLPVKHYHILFTVPHQLHELCLHNTRMFYDLLFAAVWHTLRSFGYSHYGCETGAVAVLHTWGQNLSLHPHVHCLRKQNDLQLFDEQIQRSYNTPWVVHCEPSLANAKHVIRYLGQYTHRVAITNQRIVNIADGKVTFVAKDYRQGAVKKLISLEGVEFLRRFCLHILPRRFVKIRHFGICNHTVKRNLELRFRVEDKSGINTKTKPGKTAESTIERFERLTGINPCRCQVCKSGRMLILRKLPPIRSPTYHHFAQTQPQL